MKKFTGQQQENFLALVCGDVKILPPLVVGKLVRAALRALRRQESYGVKQYWNLIRTNCNYC